MDFLPDISVGILPTLRMPGRSRCHPVSRLRVRRDAGSVGARPQSIIAARMPFLTEVYFPPATRHTEKVVHVSQLITDPRSRGTIVVAVCHYEGELPA